MFYSAYCEEILLDFWSEMGEPCHKLSSNLYSESAHKPAVGSNGSPYYADNVKILLSYLLIMNIKSLLFNNLAEGNDLRSNSIENIRDLEYPSYPCS